MKGIKKKMFRNMSKNGRFVNKNAYNGVSPASATKNKIKHTPPKKTIRLLRRTRHPVKIIKCARTGM